VSYPSLCDNNILRGCLVTEVLYWAHKLRGRRRLESGGEGSPVGQEQDGAAGETGQTGDEREREQFNTVTVERDTFVDLHFSVCVCNAGIGVFFCRYPVEPFWKMKGEPPFNDQQSS